MKVMIEEAKNQSTGTNIDLGGQKKSTKEIELFETNRRINADLKQLVNDKSAKYDIINVVSSFQPIGYQISGISKNKAVQLAFLGAFFMIFILLFIQLNSYLNNYKK